MNHEETKILTGGQWNERNQRKEPFCTYKITETPRERIHRDKLNSDAIGHRQIIETFDDIQEMTNLDFIETQKDILNQIKIIKSKDCIMDYDEKTKKINNLEKCSDQLEYFHKTLISAGIDVNKNSNSSYERRGKNTNEK